MCLYLKSYTPRYATKDIKVYKLLRHNKNGTLVSPFKMFPYELNKVYTSPLLRTVGYFDLKYLGLYPETSVRSKSTKNNIILVPYHNQRVNDFGFITGIYIEKLIPVISYVENTVDKGIHVFSNENAAEMFLAKEKLLTIHLYECTIPKGSWYYIGEFGELASDQIIINKLCV